MRCLVASLPGLLLAAALPAIASPGIPGKAPLLIEDVTVLDLERDTRERGRDVLIVDGRIARIARQIEAPDGARVIDAEGHFLLPGLAEMHAHIPGADNPDFRDRVLFLYLAAGVTTARGMLGEASHLALRDDAASYQLLSPRIYTSGPSLNGRSVDGAARAVSMVTAQHEAGYDFVKLHPGLSRAEYDAMATTADKLRIPFAGHVSLDVGLDRALAASQASIDHLDGYLQALVPPGTTYPDAANGFFGARLAALADPARIPKLAQATAAAGVWNVPTQTLIENVALPVSPDTLAARPEMKFMPAATVDSWRRSKASFLAGSDYDEDLAKRFVDLRRQLILALHEAGAGLLLGSDAPQVFNVPGFAAHRELAALVDAGLTPREALLTATVNPAAFFGARNTFGAVREGLEADLLLLTADPTADIGNIAKIEAVIARGRWLSREFIDETLEGLARP